MSKREELEDAFDAMHRVTEGGCDTRGKDVADMVLGLGYLPIQADGDSEAAWIAWKDGCVTRPPKASFMAGWAAALHRSEVPEPSTEEDEFAPGQCDGSGTCAAERHIHGCYTPHRADQCDAPEEYGHLPAEPRGEPSEATIREAVRNGLAEAALLQSPFAHQTRELVVEQITAALRAARGAAGEPSDAEVGRAVVSYRDERNRHGHMNSDIHFRCMRAALRAARDAR